MAVSDEKIYGTIANGLMYSKLIEELNQFNTQLIAVSKTKPNQAILELYDLGHRDFGENRVQELLEKEASLPKDIRWHLIGHLQTNKVKYIAPFVYMIHSVDSPKLLKEINKQAEKNGVTIKCLLQFKIAQEDTKYGFDLTTATEMLGNSTFQQFSNVEICGVMGMATNTEDQTQVREEFRSLKAIFLDLKKQFFNDQSQFEHLSMGMSGDYQIAMEEGSTMVRIGSMLFGQRIYA